MKRESAISDFKGETIVSLNSTPVSERISISFFGCRNAGKSSLINAVTNQNVSIVSDVKGTTTDPVSKTMELLPLGPVIIYDTPGIDDYGELGKLRVKKTIEILNKTDIAVVVIDSTIGASNFDNSVIEMIEKRKIPYIVCFNKSDINAIESSDENCVYVSAKTGKNISLLKEMLSKQIPQKKEKSLTGGLVRENDIVILVIPIDSGAPKDRLILPQQQTIRDLLETSCITIVVKETELKRALETFREKVSLVITDSQAFKTVSELVPENIPLTSFSILMMRKKGSLSRALNDVRTVDRLQDGDRILICEGCTHHRQCDDIGSVKIPNWLKLYTKKKLLFEFTSGKGFPEDLSKYKLIIHCGGCMLSQNEVQYRQDMAENQKIPMTNYGLLISYLNNIIDRSIRPFGNEID